MLTRRSLVLLVLCLLPYIMMAQPADSGEKVKAQRRAVLVDQIVADIADLKLAENRATAYARAGSIEWPLDQKRAISLYQNAISELINAQMLAESSTKTDGGQNDLLNGSGTRQQILNTIASHDAALALDYLFKTRPAAVTKAMSADRDPKKIGNNSGNYIAQNEFNMEQSFVRMAAEQDPARAKKLIEDAIAKGISGETLGLLKKLSEKEPSGAAGLASQVVDKLMRTELTVNGQPNYLVTQLMTGVLNEFLSGEKTTERTLKFDESQLRAMAQKLLSYSLEYGNYDGGYMLYSLIPIAQRFAPSTVETLKTVARNSNCRGFCGAWDPEIQTLMNNGETTPEVMLAAANKVPGNQRNSIYQSAANKYVQQGNVSKARELISEKFSDDEADEIMRNLDNQYACKLMNEGNFSSAEQLIDTFPVNQRIGALINLANTAYARDNEKNKAYALALISKVRDVIGDPPENNFEFQSVMQVVTSLMNIDPPEAFRIYESLVPQMNDLSDAAAVIYGFQGGSNVRSGEFVIAYGSSFGYYGADSSQLPVLARSDFDRTLRLIDSFTRREIRVALKLQLAEGMN